MVALNKYYRPELDLLRFFAFLFVFFTHRMDLAPIDPIKYYWAYHISLVGVFGVPLFFLLSAFLLTELLTKEQEQFGKINIKSFYIRRMLRIWPLYFFFFFGMVYLSHYTDSFDKPITTTAQLAFSLFAGNWYITFYEWFHYPVNPLWSVSVEEQLYIFLPLIIFFKDKKGLKVFSLLALIVAYITIIYYAAKPTTGFSGEWTNSFVHFQFFAAGILLSVYLKGWLPQWNAIFRLVLFFSGLVCWLTASIFCGIHADLPHTSTIPQALLGWFLVLSGAIFFFFAFYGAASKYVPRVLAYLGRISYGMYVFHITTFWLAYKIFREELAQFSRFIGFYDQRNNIGFVICLLATILISIISYRFLETPFLKLKKRFTLISSRD